MSSPQKITIYGRWANFKLRWQAFFMRPAVRWAWMLPGAFIQAFFYTYALSSTVPGGSWVHAAFPETTYDAKELSKHIINLFLPGLFVGIGVRIAPRNPLVVGYGLFFLALGLLFALALLVPPRGLSFETVLEHVLGASSGLYYAWMKHLVHHKRPRETYASTGESCENFLF